MWPALLDFMWVNTIRRESTTEETAEIFSRQKCKARTAVGRGEEELATYMNRDLSYD